MAVQQLTAEVNRLLNSEDCPCKNVCILSDNKSVNDPSMNIFLFCFLTLFFSYSLFGKNSEKEVVVNISNNVRYRKS